MTKSVRKEKHYKHSIQDVWNAITNEKEIASWFIQADFKAEKGYQYTFTHQETKITGTVLEANPVYLLVYTWDVNYSGVETTVRWNLSEKDGGTLLVLEHTGAENYPKEEMAAEMFGHFDKGWQNCINDLENYLAKAEHVK